MIEAVLVWVVCALVCLALLQRAARGAVASDAAVAVVDRTARAVGGGEPAPCPRCDDPNARSGDCADCPRPS